MPNSGYKAFLKAVCACQIALCQSRMASVATTALDLETAKFFCPLASRPGPSAAASVTRGSGLASHCARAMLH